MEFTRKLLVVINGIAAIALAGCALHYELLYNKPYVEFASANVPTLFHGKAMVITTKEADQEITHNFPISGPGGRVSFDFDGTYCRDIALAMFGKAFEGGALHSSTLPSQQAVSVVAIEPRLAKFERKSNGYDIEGRVVLNVKFHLNNGRTVEKQYDSGFVAFAASSGFTVKNTNSFLYQSKPKGEIAVHHAFVVAYELCIKDMESFVPLLTSSNSSSGGN
jgi:hypothetical protein